MALAHPLKVKAIAEARIKTDKISADILADLLLTSLVPRAYTPNKQTRDLKNFLRQRVFFVRVQSMVKNRIYDVLDRHPADSVSILAYSITYLLIAGFDAGYI